MLHSFGDLLIKGHCQGNQLKLQNRHFSQQNFFVTLPFQNGFEYRISNRQQLEAH